MSLNWNISKIADHKSVCLRENENGDGSCLKELTNNLIWMTIAVDLGEITAKNVDEWKFRLNCIALVYDEKWQTEITREDIAQHIGLSTNVSSTTRKQFIAKMARALESEVSNSIRRGAVTA
jgi:hypothetical protein